MYIYTLTYVYTYMCIYTPWISSKNIFPCTSPPSIALGLHRPSATDLDCQGAVQRHFTQFHHCGAVAFDRETAVGDEIPLPVQGKHQFLRVGSELDIFCSRGMFLVFFGAPRLAKLVHVTMFVEVYHGYIVPV